MLQTIREHTQGWIAGTIISIIILTFALWGIHSYFIGGGNNGVIAKVNGIDITREQLTVAYERLRRQVQSNPTNPALAKDERALKDRALQALTEIEILKQASIAQGFYLSDRQIDNYLQSMPDFQVDGRFSLERFQEVLSSTLLTTGEFLDLIKTSLLIDQPKLGIIFSSIALPNEVDYTISLVNQERDIDYIIIPRQYFLSQPIVISPDKIKAYYAAHKNEFMTPEQVNVDYLELSTKQLSSHIDISDALLKNFYTENINAYTQPMMWKIASVEVPITTANEVAQAQKKADDLAKSLAKGDAALPAQSTMPQGWMTVDQLPTEWQAVVSKLNKPHAVSGPIKTTKGFVVVKVLDIKQPTIQSFDAVKEKVKEAYLHQRAEEKFAELREQLSDLTYEHPESLTLAAKTLGLPIQTSELFTKEKAGKDIAQYRKVREAAFSNDVLNLQNNSDVIQVAPDTVVVIRVKSHIPSTLLGVDSLSQQIADKLKVEDADVRTAKLAEELKMKLQTGADLKILASTYHFSVNKAGFIGRYSKKVDSAILDTAFQLPIPHSVDQKTYGISRLQDGYAIIALNHVKVGTVADKKQYAVFAEQVQNSEGLLEYELYRQSQARQAKIKILQ